MDALVLRDRLVEDYKSHVGSFIKIKDARIDEQVMYERRITLAWNQLRDREVPIAEVCGAMGISRSMFYRHLTSGGEGRIVGGTYSEKSG